MSDLLENAIAKYDNKLKIFRIVTNDRAIHVEKWQTANAENTLQQWS